MTNMTIFNDYWQMSWHIYGPWPRCRLSPHPTPPWPLFRNSCLKRAERSCNVHLGISHLLCDCHSKILATFRVPPVSPRFTRTREALWPEDSLIQCFFICQILPTSIIRNPTDCIIDWALEPRTSESQRHCTGSENAHPSNTWVRCFPNFSHLHVTITMFATSACYL